MLLELLERIERRQPGILVVQADDEAHVHPVCVEVIEEAAAVGPRIQRPAESVLNQPGLDPPSRQLPQLLHAEAVVLRAAVRVQLEMGDELFRQAAASAFGHYGDGCAHFGPGSVVRSGLAVLVDPHVAELHAGDGAVGIEQRLGGRKAGKNIDAQPFRLAGKPGRQQTQRDDEVAVVVQL